MSIFRVLRRKRMETNRLTCDVRSPLNVNKRNNDKTADGGKMKRGGGVACYVNW